jgi:hypothetical protein
VRFHYLIATLKLVIDPTRDIDQPLWCQTALVAKAAIDWYGISVLEMLDNYV